MLQLSAWLSILLLVQLHVCFNLCLNALDTLSPPEVQREVNELIFEASVQNSAEAENAKTLNPKP